MLSWGDAIVRALENAVNIILTFIPNVIGFLIILLVGWLIAWAVSRGLTFLLRKIGFDRLSNRIGLTRFEQRMGISLDPAGVLGTLVFWFLFIIFLIPAANALGVPSVSNILNQLVAYIPNVFVAILVLFLGTLAATLVSDLVRGATATANVGNPGIFANIARWAIIGFAALIALEQLQIAPALLNILFTAIVGAAAIALGLAFGLGGQDAARRWLARGESTVTTAASQIQAQQQVNQARAQNEQVYAEQARQAQMQAQAQQTQAQQAQQAYPPQQPQQPYPSQYDNNPPQPPYNSPTSR